MVDSKQLLKLSRQSTLQQGHLALLAQEVLGLVLGACLGQAQRVVLASSTVNRTVYNNTGSSHHASLVEKKHACLASGVSASLLNCWASLSASRRGCLVS